MIRLIQLDTNDRALIKDIKSIKDISFALSPNDIILGCADEEGNLYVYHIDNSKGSLMYVAIL